MCSLGNRLRAFLIGCYPLRHLRPHSLHSHSSRHSIFAWATQFEPSHNRHSLFWPFFEHENFLGCREFFTLHRQTRKLYARSFYPLLSFSYTVLTNLVALIVLILVVRPRCAILFVLIAFVLATERTRHGVVRLFSSIRTRQRSRSLHVLALCHDIRFRRTYSRHGVYSLRSHSSSPRSVLATESFVLVIHALVRESFVWGVPIFPSFILIVLAFATSPRHFFSSSVLVVLILATSFVLRLFARIDGFSLVCSSASILSQQIIRVIILTLFASALSHFAMHVFNLVSILAAISHVLANPPHGSEQSAKVVARETSLKLLSMGNKAFRDNEKVADEGQSPPFMFLFRTSSSLGPRTSIGLIVRNPKSTSPDIKPLSRRM